MCRITMAQTLKHRITSRSLLERLGVDYFDNYYIVQPPLTTLGRTRRTHARESDAAQAFNWLG
jgi:hypothetical protein